MYWGWREVHGGGGAAEGKACCVSQVWLAPCSGRILHSASACTLQNSEIIKSPYLDQFLTKHPNWHVPFSENRWTSNDITIEWLEKVFSPQTQSGDSADTRLLIVDGHGSHTSDEFMTICCLNNIYLLFLPAHTSHVLQPLD